MKVQSLSIVVVLALACGSAHAAFTDTESGGAKASSTAASSTPSASAAPAGWAQVAATVKAKVTGWLGAWTKSETTPPTATTQPSAKPVSRTTSSTEAPGSASQAGSTSAPSAPMARTLPKVEGSSLSDVQAVRDKVKASSILKVVTPGRPAAPDLVKTKAGVPVAPWASIKVTKKISLLNVGTENQISRDDFAVVGVSWGLYDNSEVKRLSSPANIPSSELAIIAGTKVIKPLGFHGIQANTRSMNKPVTLEMVEKVSYSIAPEKEIKEMPYVAMTADELKLLAALILVQKGDYCHMVMGLFHQLASSEKTKLEAMYHLGLCAAQLKLHQSAFSNLSAAILSENPDYASTALATLAKGLPNVYEKDFYKMFKSLKNENGVISAVTKEGALNDIRYHLAKGAYHTGDYKTSGAFADAVTGASSLHDEARYLSAMDSFALNDKQAALKKLLDVWKLVEPRKGADSSNIRALTNLNLARIYFALKKYDKAHEHYMQVPKDHPLWVQALIEQGWTQMALGDYAGAIGNMYSLHSPYFKAVYQPESFVVRSIGYLNICQYGDAYRTLSYLEKEYREWGAKLGNYLTTKNKPTDLYGSVRNYIKGKSTEDMEGVPFQVWRGMAHRKDFLNLQTALNDQSDELHRFEGVNGKIKEEKASIRWRAEQAKKRFDQWKAQIAKAQIDRSLQKNLNQWNASMNLERDLTIAYRFQLAILEQGRQGFLEFQGKAQTGLEKEAANLYRKAGEVLLAHAKAMKTEMGRVLENNELLRYEVFAGSGENIRYQVAGGEVSGANRIPASIRPSKMMNWSFDGEFWEDEIGSYRSSLQNNCPKSGTN